MEIPFLKNKNKQGGGGPVKEITRESDVDYSQSLLDRCCEEFVDAVHKKDFKSMRESLHALVSMIKDMGE